MWLEFNIHFFQDSAQDFSEHTINLFTLQSFSQNVGFVHETDSEESIWAHFKI